MIGSISSGSQMRLSGVAGQHPRLGQPTARSASPATSQSLSAQVSCQNSYVIQTNLVITHVHRIMLSDKCVSIYQTYKLLISFDVGFCWVLSCNSVYENVQLYLILLPCALTSILCRFYFVYFCLVFHMTSSIFSMFISDLQLSSQLSN